MVILTASHKRMVSLTKNIAVYIGFLSAFGFTKALGQGLTPESNPNIPFFEANVYYGKTLNIHPFFPESDNAMGFELHYRQLTRGKKYWHQQHGHPELGMSLLYMDFGNADVMGQAIAFHPNLTFGWEFGDWFSLNLQTGGGLAWFNKPFNAFDNPDNFVIGSRFTALAGVIGHARFRLNDQFTLSTGGGMWHYSNGHIKVPNIGANVLMAKAGITYYPKPITNDFTYPLEEVELDKKFRFNLTFGLGFHEVEGTVLPYDGPTYPVYYTAAILSKRKSYRSNHRLGIALNYYTAFRDFIVTQDIFQENIDAKSYKAVLFYGHEFFFGHLAFSTKFGYNLYFPLRHKMIDLGIYEKKFTHLHLSHELAMHYYLKDTKETLRYNPFIGLGLKTIGGKADYVSVRVGMQF